MENKDVQINNLVITERARPPRRGESRIVRADAEITMTQEGVIPGNPPINVNCTVSGNTKTIFVMD